MAQTFQTFLEIGTTTPKGCAVIRLPASNGIGTFEFEIRRVGYADSILGAKSWQPSEHWFQFQIDRAIPDGQLVPIQLDANIVGNLSNSNYSLSVRKYGDNQVFKGVLIGGLKHVEQQILSEITVSEQDKNRSDVSVSTGWENSLSRNDDTVSSETGQLKPKQKNEIELPELPAIYKESKETTQGESLKRENSQKILMNSHSNIKLSIGFFLLLLVGILFYWTYFKKLKTISDKDPNPVATESQKTETPIASMQEANRIINDLADPKAVFEIGKSWQKAGHYAEAFILLENSASNNYPPAIFEVAELYDPLYRKTHLYTFPEMDIVKSSNWYLTAYKNGVNVKDEASKLKNFINESRNLDASIKSESLSILNQII